jgi:glycosyltransferase involved in cell wall biosynthesis
MPDFAASETKEDQPMISVVLPVFNGEQTIGRGVESILNQTYGNFELIIINDGSTDRTPEILAGYKDQRLVVLEQENKGLVPSLNRGIKRARGKYIARMDADDESVPMRFEKQLSFLKQKPSCAIVGSTAKVVYPDGKERIRIRPLNTESIKKNIVRVCPFTHSSVMIRKSVFDRVGLYDQSLDGSKELLVEDYDLWVRILATGDEMANLPDVLITNFRGEDSILRRRSITNRIKQQIFSRIRIIKFLNLGYLAYLNLIPVSIVSILIHYKMCPDWLFNFISRK